MTEPGSTPEQSTPASSLERGYRRLIRAYPRSYRERRGEEMLATLLESAVSGRTRPTRRDAAELLAGAMRERLGIHAVPGFASGLRMAGPIAFVLAAAFATSDWLLGRRTVLATIVAIAWAAAVLVRMVHHRAGPLATILAWLTTLGVAIVAAVVPLTFEYPDGHLISLPQTPGRYLIPIAFGLIAVVATLTHQSRSSIVDRLAGPAAVGGLLAITAIVNGVGRLHDVLSLSADYPAWTNFVWLAPLAILLGGLVTAIARRQTELLWAGALIAVPTPVTFPVGVRSALDGRLQAVPDGAIFFLMTGATQAAILAAAFATTLALTAAHHTAPAPRNGRQAIERAGAICLGVAVGSCLPVLLLQLFKVRYGQPETRLLSMALIAFPVAVAVAAMLLPRAAIRYTSSGLAIILVVFIVLSGPRALAEPTVLGAAALLLLASAAATGPGARSWVGLGAVLSAGLVAAASWVGNGVNVRLFTAPAEMLVYERTLVPTLALAVLLPTLWWIGVVAVQRLRRSTANA